MERADPAEAPDPAEPVSAVRMRDGWWLIVIAMAATVVRLAAIVHHQLGIAHQVGASYDEAIYLGGSWSLWSHGSIPYHDFVWVFPPGHVVALAPVTLLSRLLGGGPGGALTLARVLSAVAGGVSTYLIGRITTRWTGIAAGIAAALLYATSPVAWPTEATALQEPLVNLIVLVAAWWWLRPGPNTARRRAGAGLLIGFALSIKLVAAVFLLPFLVVGPFRRAVRDRVGLVIFAALPLAVTGLLAMVAAGWRAPFEQAVLAQISRPRGGEGLGRIDSILPLFRGQVPLVHWMDRLSPWFAVVAATALAGAAIVRGGRIGRFWGVTLLAVGAALLASPSYFSHYGAMAAPALSALLAWALVVTTRRFVTGTAERRDRAVVGVALVCATLQVAAAVPLLTGPRSPLSWRFTNPISASDCVFAVRPQLLFDLGRLPSPGPDGQVLLDVYGAALVARLHEKTVDRDFGAYRVPSVQRELVRAAQACRLNLVSDRRCDAGSKDLTAATARAIRRGTTLIAKRGCTELLRRDGPGATGGGARAP
jgi:hypothetical protein